MVEILPSSRLPEGTEAVVNDPGLLELLAGRGWPGPLAAGRLLTRQRRGRVGRRLGLLRGLDLLLRILETRELVKVLEDEDDPDR